MKNRIKVLMVGPARDVKGGMSTVVNDYYSCGLQNKVELRYIESINDKNKIRKFLKEKSGIRAFKKEIANYEIVHIHMASRRSTFRKIKYLQIAKKNKKRVIIHVHGGGFRDFFEKEANIRQRDYIVKNLNKADAIIVLSEIWREYFSELLTTKIVILNNAVVIPGEICKKKDNSFLFLGRLTEGKGIYDLLNVLPTIIRNYPDVRLNIGGVGEDDKVRKIVKNNNLSEYINILGWADKKKKELYLKETTFFILPSYHEAMPMSLLESMAYGCIPIVSKVGSVDSVIVNEKNGFMTCPGNQLDLKDTILKALSLSSRKRIELSNMAKDTIKNSFNEKLMIKRLLSLYRSIQKDSE